MCHQIVTACVLLAGVARAQSVVVGVNVVNPMRASVADQNAVFSQLEAAHGSPRGLVSCKTKSG